MVQIKTMDEPQVKNNYTADIILGRDIRGEEVGVAAEFMRHVELMDLKVKVPSEFYNILHEYVDLAVVRGELPEGMGVMDVFVVQGMLGVVEAISEMKKSL